MLRKEEKFVTPTKKLRFRGDLNFYHFNENRCEDLLDDDKRTKNGEVQTEQKQKGSYLINIVD